MRDYQLCREVNIPKSISGQNGTVERPRCLEPKEAHLMHWSNFSRKKLANLIITMDVEYLKVAMGTLQHKTERVCPLPR